MNPVRRCSRIACAQPACATLTYVYAESTAILGPLSVTVEPHSYDLCQEHSRRLTAPRGWEVVRLDLADQQQPPGADNDLEALAQAVRVASTRTSPPAPGRGIVDQLVAQGHVVRSQHSAPAKSDNGNNPGANSRRGHLIALPDLE